MRRKLHQSSRIRSDQSSTHRRFQPRQQRRPDPNQDTDRDRTTRPGMRLDDRIEHALHISNAQLIQRNPSNDGRTYNRR